MDGKQQRNAKPLTITTYLIKPIMRICEHTNRKNKFAILHAVIYAPFRYD